jgi:4-amino-4-deoxy-L-arabinose transferase-like glycosyltransferase
MTQTLVEGHARRHSVRTGRWTIYATILALCGAFMFLDARTTPIVLWDESRIAVNALEMHLGGHLSLVTTYGFRPDLWNTKPPLLIWLMDLCAGAFGPSEWSLRLPSMAAAMATVALTAAFTRRATRSWTASALSAALLTFSLSFFGEHGARTADYEALLTFFTTSYLSLLYFALHRRRPAPVRVLTAGLAASAAVLTKSLAGGIPGLGVVLYLLLVARWRRPLQTPWYGVAAAMVAATGLGWYALREQIAPGYLRAALFNDVSGRFTKTLDRHSGSPLYYVDNLVRGGSFSAGFLLAPAPLALWFVKGRARLALLYSLCIVIGAIGVLSLSATKLSHYAAMTLPFAAIATAIAMLEAVRAADRAYANGRLQIVSPLMVRVFLAAMLALVALRAGYARYIWLPDRGSNPQSLYGELFRSLRSRNVERVAVVDGGVVNWPGVAAAGVPDDYAPQLDFYMLLARTSGLVVQRIAPGALPGLPHGMLVASCDPRLERRLDDLGRNLSQTAGCVAVRR